MTGGDTGIRLLLTILGFWIVMRSVNKDASGRTLIDRILGQSGGANQTLPSSTGSTPAAKAGQVNPIPGASANRLDQGFDVTGKNFLAPFTGKVVASSQSDPGWGGGGYIAIQNATNPNDVIYMAEGLAPLLQKGATVTAGERVAVPRMSPYPSGGFGTIEIGPANPKNPLQPLAQVVSDPAGAVMKFYDWLRSLGAPAATSTSLAGHA